MCQIITAAHVQAQFHAAGKRVPRGYLVALDRLVSEIVACGVCRAEAPEIAAGHARVMAPLTGSDVSKAIAAREAAGKLDAPGLLAEARLVSATVVA